jgi:hypothetical protein
LSLTFVAAIADDKNTLSPNTVNEPVANERIFFKWLLIFIKLQTLISRHY